MQDRAPILTNWAERVLRLGVPALATVSPESLFHMQFDPTPEFSTFWPLALLACFNQVVDVAFKKMYVSGKIRDGVNSFFYTIRSRVSPEYALLAPCFGAPRCTSR